MPATARSSPTTPAALLSRAELEALSRVRRKACRHGTMLVDVEGGRAGRSLELYGEYLETTAILLQKLLQPGEVVVEAGAGVGGLTLPMAKRVGAKGRIHAFEPRPLAQALLVANLGLNQLEGRVTARRAALGATPGQFEVEAEVETPDGEGGPVERLTIDQLGLARCQLFCINVREGALEVLQGAQRTLARCRPALYVANEQQAGSEALIRFLVKQGYRLHWHLPRLFRPDNFSGLQENVLGTAPIGRMLGMPRGDRREPNLPRIVTPSDWWGPKAAQPAAPEAPAPVAVQPSAPMAAPVPAAAPADPPAPGGAAMFDAAFAAHRAGKLEEAFQLYDRAIEIGFNRSGAFTNIGVLLRQQKKFDAAIIAHRRALELTPADPSVMGNLGNALKDAGRFEEAIALKRRVVELRADAESWHGLGIAYRDASRAEEAEAAFRKAVELAPDDAEMRFNLALAQLHLENFAEGWANYETRWQLDRQKKRAFNQPWWRGEPFPKKTLLLFAEQGFGDTIQFIRFVAEAKARGGTVLLECQKELARLMQSVEGLDGIIIRDTPEAERVLERVDLVCPLASLPGHCKVDLAKLPGRVPYMAPPTGLERKFDALLARAQDRLRVGIVWSGSITFAENANRSAGLKPYLRFAEIPGVQLYGLQKGPRLDELKALGTDSLIIDASHLLDDFADTAALIGELDLVLMTDSSVAHLTGALGRPIWVMLMQYCDWRWLQDRSDSPWYPSARLFRQEKARDWEHVFERVAGELAKLAAARPKHRPAQHPAPAARPVPIITGPAPTSATPPAAAPVVFEWPLQPASKAVPMVPPPAPRIAPAPAAAPVIMPVMAPQSKLVVAEMPSPAAAAKPEPQAPLAAMPSMPPAPASRPLEIEIELAPPPAPPPPPPARDGLLLPSALLDPAGRPRFAMPIPQAFLKDAGLRVLAQEEKEQGGFEYATRRFLDEHLEPGDLFIDVGAHWGIYALTAATRHPGAVDVLAIEASPLNVEHLRRWVAHNRLEERIEIVAAGAADREGFATVAPQSTMGHHIEAISEERGGQGIRIPVTTLDRLIADRPALQGRRCFIKIDVEGLEPEVIEGASTLMRSGLVQAVIFERGRSYNNPPGRKRWQALLDTFTSLGFELWRMPHENMGGPLMAYAVNDNLCNVFALKTGFEQRTSYAKPFGTVKPPFRLQRQPTEQDLVDDTLALLRARTADVERWAMPDTGSAAQLRARMAAAEIPHGASVIDLGAGAMLVRDRLDPASTYRPVDLFPLAADMTTLDLERADLVSLGRFDTALALAVLEYLHDPARFLGQLAALAPLAIVTYPIATPTEPPRLRRRRGIVNDLDAAALTSLFTTTGWQPTRRAPLADGSTLFVLERG